MAAAYPHAPVLLSHRGSAEAWYRSMEPTVLARTRDVLASGDPDDPLVTLFGAIFQGVLTDLDYPADVMAGYVRHLARVREAIEPGRLIEWQPADGWGPICRALGVPVPDQEFPHRNSRGDYLIRAEARRAATPRS